MKKSIRNANVVTYKLKLVLIKATDKRLEVARKKYKKGKK